MEDPDKLTRNDSTQAMRSIFSAYTDEEIAEDAAPGSVDNISGSEDESVVVVPSGSAEVQLSAEEGGADEEEETSPKRPKLQKRATKLVSYGPAEEEEDEEEEDESENEDSGFPLVNYDVSMNQSELDGALAASAAVETSLEDEEKVPLPPEPQRKCSRELQQKISELYDKMRRTGMDMTRNIQHRKDFRNPSIYEKLIELLGIDEKATNYPPEIYNTSIWGPESFYDQLAKVQKEEMEKKERERKDKTKIEFVTGTKRLPGDSLVLEPKRKSKWDSQPQATSVAKPVIVTTTALHPPVVSIMTSSSGSKTTVISAVGTIKKPK